MADALIPIPPTNVNFLRPTLGGRAVLTLSATALTGALILRAVTKQHNRMTA
jgi:hypothetical protein